MTYETPPILSGEAESQLDSLWRYLYRLVEKLNVDSPEVQTIVDNGLAPMAYNQLRDMIGTNVKALSKLSKDKVDRTELKSELESLLREAEESGAFDGNGINYVRTNADYSVTFGFTDGTYYTTPVLNQISVGDVFSTTREGAPGTLLGYGTWELITDSPIYMYKRIT